MRDGRGFHLRALLALFGLDLGRGKVWPGVSVESSVRFVLA